VLLLDNEKIEARRQATRSGAPLAPLYDSLASELEPLVGKAPYIPAAKALLSRAGGRCELDGATLDFDPASPHAHRCPTCGTIHRGETHDRAWITSYQLWLAERSVHAALFCGLRGDHRHGELARDILRAYADGYLRYPNRDNVLGPTRLFFSTYLESIWLLQICIAADLLAHTGDQATADLVRDRIVEPSSALIAEYDEGLSNRQVWNNAALLASAALRSDADAFDRLIDGDSGVRAHLSVALLDDGTWYEGENYHQFALRGLWYGVTLCEASGRRLPTELAARFNRAFEAPFLTALPDFTMPSRKDSQYAVSLRQWRIAELTELGFARSRARPLGAALARCYETGHARRDTGRASSTADVESNGPPGALTRADLGWRALLHALPELPPLEHSPPRSALLSSQGLAVFRRSDDVYVALDYGQSGGGHGHPDRLNLLLSQGTTRWLDDMGTGSYVDPSLHWYRSTLAHNAPLFDGRSQLLRDGHLLAHDEREAMGWIHAQLSDVEGVSFRRTVVVAPEYLVDELTWSARRPARIELPWHVDATVTDVEFQPATFEGGNGLEDGFSFMGEARAASIGPNTPIQLEARRDGRRLRAILHCVSPVTLYRVSGPGQPPAESRIFLVVRVESGDASDEAPRTGVMRAVLAWSDEVVGARFEESHVMVEYHGGETHRHARNRDGWRVEFLAGGAKSSIDLAGSLPKVSSGSQSAPVAQAPTVVRRSKVADAWFTDLGEESRSRFQIFELSKQHYRRSEESWDSAGAPIATVAVAADDRRLVLYALVRAGERRFAAASSTNALDNEHPDTMAAGVQLYLRTPETGGAWMLVPDASTEVRVRPIEGWGSMAPPRARWREDGEGYEMRIEIPLLDAPIDGEYPVDVDVIVNETTKLRDRRRGQLVMSGARGEFVYLRGDRHDPTRLIPLVIVP